MKALLGSLMCLLLGSAECFALKGGPPYPGGGINIVGRYAGVLRPPFCPLSNPAGCGVGLNSLGIFTMPIPQSGVSDGSLLIFSAGRTFVGTITALGNPNTGTLTGVVNASYQTSVTTTTSTGTTIISLRTHATAGGGLQANVTTVRSGFLGTSSVLLRGTAVLGIVDLDNPALSVSDIPFEVDGFKQSNTTQ